MSAELITLEEVTNKFLPKARFRLCRETGGVAFILSVPGNKKEAETILPRSILVSGAAAVQAVMDEMPNLILKLYDSKPKITVVK